MTISEILSTARDLAWQPQTWYFTDAILLKYLEIVYQENVDYIATFIKWWRYATDLTFNLTEWVYTYALPVTSSTEQWLKEIQRVEILVNGNWKVLVERKLTQLQEVPYEYDNFYFIKWDSIELVRTWHKTQVWGLKVYGTTDVIDITLATTEANIDLPYDWWYLLAMWIVPYMNAIERRYDEEQVAEQRYRKKLREKIAQAKLKRYQTIYKDNPPADDVYRE